MAMVGSKKTGLSLLAALCRYPNYRLAPLFLLALLTTACGGGGGGSNDSGPSDTTRPGVQIQDAPDSHDGRTAFTLRIRFSESVSGFVRGDISVSGAAVTAFSGSGASYTATLTPSTPPGTIAFEVPANVAQDAAGNGNTAAARQTVAYVAPDTTPPTVSINAPERHNGQPFEVTFVFSEPVRGFEVADIRITGARIAPLPSQTSSSRYTATITANTPLGNITLEVPANVARDLAGNGNTAAARQTVVYVPPDTTPPRVSINAPGRHNGRPFAVSFVFSEAVRGFEAADIRISGGRITAFSSQASSSSQASARYTATLTPSTPLGNIALEVPANVAQDAAGNGNTATARQTVVYVPPDTTPPRVSINAPERHNGRPFAVSFVFSEAVRGFEAADIRVTGARITRFSSQASARYTATLTPSTPLGNIALEVPANVARDLAGNGNTATARQTVAYVPPDTTPPRVSINAPERHNGSPFEVTFVFSEPVRGFEAGDIRIVGARISPFPSQALSTRYTATLTPNTPPANIAFDVPANAARDAAGNGNTATAPRRIEYVAPPTAEKVRISGRLSFDRPAFTRGGGLDYSNIRQQPIRGVWVEAVNASATVLERTRSDASGRYRLDVDANTEVRIRIRAHMQRSAAGGPRWDVKVTDNTNGNALYVAQGNLASSGTGASTRNLNAASGWVASDSGGRYANARVAGPFAILSSTYEALQRFARVDPDINLPALEYRWSVRNRSAAGNLADGAIGRSFYNPAEQLIYLVGQENEDTDEYDHSVILHEFAHHFTSTLSRDDSLGGNWSDEARLDMRLAFSEGFGDALGAIITDDPLYRDTFGSNQGLAGVQNMETNPVNPTTDANRIGWYHSRSVAAIVYDLYDAADDGADRLSLGLAPIYNALTSNGFKNNRHYTSIYTFANQLPEHVSNRTATQSGLDALLRRHNIFGRGDNGAGETNGGGLPATARVLPVYKSITSGDTPITLCSVNDAGVFNRLGNRAFVQVNFTENGAHTLTLTLSESTSALPLFGMLPYASRASANCTPSWDTSRPAGNTPKNCTFTGNFQASEAARVAAFDLQNFLFGSPGADSCFTFSVVKNS